MRYHVPENSYMKERYNPYNVTVYVGSYTSVANGIRIISAEHPSQTYNTVSNYPFRERLRRKGINVDYPRCRVGGEVHIGSDVWIGENVTLYGERKIGDGVIIGGL